MAKFNLKVAQAAIGIGTFVEKTIKFRDKDGNEFEGEIKIKIVDHDTLVNASSEWGLDDPTKLTIDQQRKALIHQVVYEDQKSKFFPKIEDTGKVSTEVVDAMFSAADEVLDFSGKNWISNTKMNSGANSSSTELAEEQ